MAYDSLSINYKEDHNSWDFRKGGQAFELYKKIREEFAGSEFESKQEAFEDKDIVQMKIVPVKEKSDVNLIPSIIPETFFRPDKFREMIEFAEKEYRSNKD